LGSGRWGDEAQQLDDAALEDAVVAAREGGAEVLGADLLIDATDLDLVNFVERQR
jgi:hypothetical protein